MQHDREDHCPWESFGVSVNNNGDQRVKDAYVFLNKWISSDQTQHDVLRPNIARPQLQLNDIREYFVDLHAMLRKSQSVKTLKKYQIMSVLYNIQAAVTGQSMIMALGTGMGKTIIMGTTASVLAKRGFLVYLVEKQKDMKNKHREKGDYLFLSDDSIMVKEDLSSIDQLNEGGVMWVTQNHLKSYLKKQTTDDVHGFTEGCRGAMFIDEAHLMLSKDQLDLKPNEYHKSQLLNNWLMLNEQSAKANSQFTIHAYTATPGDVPKQLKICGAAFGSHFRTLIKNTSSFDRFPSLISKGGMIAYHMKTVSGLSMSSFLPQDDGFKLMDHKANNTIDFSASHQYLLHFKQYLSLGYLLCVSDKVQDKRSNYLVIGQIMKKMRFVNSIHLMLRFIVDLNQYPQKYIDHRNDKLRSVFYLKEYNEDLGSESGNALQHLIQHIQSCVSKSNFKTTKDCLDYFRGKGVTLLMILKTFSMHLGCF